MASYPEQQGKMPRLFALEEMCELWVPTKATGAPGTIASLSVIFVLSHTTTGHVILQSMCSPISVDTQFCIHTVWLNNTRCIMAVFTAAYLFHVCSRGCQLRVNIETASPEASSPQLSSSPDSLCINNVYVIPLSLLFWYNGFDDWAHNTRVQVQVKLFLSTLWRYMGAEV